MLAAACTSGGAPQTPPVNQPTPGTQVNRPNASAVSPSKVLVVVEENHAQNAALRDMHYLASLASAYGQTTDYRALAHPSLPNYLAIAGGSTFGVTDDRDPANHPLSGQSAFDAARTAGATAETYAEAMPAPCAPVSSGTYAVRHNPWVYFSDSSSRRNCEKSDVPSGTTTSGPLRKDIDASTLPTVGMLIPDLCHDGHDCDLGAADAWLAQWLPTVITGPDYQAGRLAIVVTFDEDDESGPNTVLTTVVSPNTEHISSAAQFTHYSVARYFAELSAAPPLRQAANAVSLRTAFHI